MQTPYKAKGTNGLFSEDFRLEKLSSQGDPLERLNGVIDWSYFRTPLEKMEKKMKMVEAGPKPYDPLLLFKILILQRYYNLSDGQTEYQILDRLTFCRFLGLSLHDRVPDEKTIWSFRNRLIEKIQNTQDGRILEEAYRLLDLEIEDIDVFELNDAQKRAISEAREQINNGQFFTEEAANKEIDEWLNE